MGDKEKRVRSQSLSSLEVELFTKEKPAKEEDEQQPIKKVEESAIVPNETHPVEESVKRSVEEPLIERPYEDMVITPMPGILPIQLNPPYRPPNNEPLPYAECRGKYEEELIFHLEF